MPHFGAKKVKGVTAGSSGRCVLFMKRVLFAIAMIGATTASALAAGSRAQEPPSTTQSWRGCFVGVNTGSAWNHGKSSYQDPNNTGDPINGLSGPFGTRNFVPTPSETDASFGIGGGGFGCSWQSRKWVYGVEADFDGMDISASQSTVGPLGSYMPGKASITLPDFVGTGNEQVSLNWLSTVRAQAGFAIQDRLLLFATGGIATADVRGQGSVSLSNNTFFETWSGSSAAIKTGYTLGGGAEWALSDRWSAKIEYLWYDLGRTSHPLNCTAGNLGGTPCNPFIYPTLGNTLSQVDGSIFRFGLNYKIDSSLVGNH
jgi:outer membrane immunogenic protein